MSLSCVYLAAMIMSIEVIVRSASSHDLITPEMYFCYSCLLRSVKKPPLRKLNK